MFATRGLPYLIGSTATSNLGSSIAGAAYLLFAYRTLHLSPATIGLVFVFGEIGFVGALLAPRIAARLGFARTLIATQIVCAVALAVVPLARRAWPSAVVISLLIASQLALTCAIPIYNILTVSSRQGAVAPELQGRVNATARTLLWGTLPIGAAFGGLLAGRIGFAATIEIGAAITLGAIAWVAPSAIRSIGFPSSEERIDVSPADAPAQPASAFEGVSRR